MELHGIHCMNRLKKVIQQALFIVNDNSIVVYYKFRPIKRDLNFFA